ncbi:MAG: hypothetical protein H7839_02940 [Magnetococcus sp. YQC-5]
MAVKEKVPQERKNRRMTAYNPSGNPLLWCKYVGYLFLGMSLYFVDLAKPPGKTFFHRIMDPGIEKQWDLDVMTLSWFFLWLALLVGIGGLILNALRLRRKNDHLSVGLIVLLLLVVLVMARVPSGNSIMVFLSHI